MANAIDFMDISKVFEERLAQLEDGIKAADRLDEKKAWEAAVQRRDELLALWSKINSLSQTPIVIDLREEA